MKENLPILILLLPLASVPLLMGLSWTSTLLNRLMVLFIFGIGWVWGWEALQTILSRDVWFYNLGGWPAPWGIEIILTPFTVFLAGWIWLIGMATWFYGLPYWMLRSQEGVKEGLFNAFLFLMLGSVLGLLFLRDILDLYFCLESALAAVAGLLVVGQAKNWRDGFNLFFWGSVASSFLLFAAFFLYVSTGTLNLDDLLSQIFISKNGAVVLIAGLLSALALGLSFCFPSPYFFSRMVSQTPSFIMGVLSSVWVRGVVYVFFILLFFTLDLPGFHQPLWLLVLEYLLIPFFLWHFVLAFQQKDFQQMIASIGVAQLGTLWIGFLLGGKSALTGTLFELLSQILVMAGLFFIAGTLQMFSSTQSLSRLAGLGWQRPWMALALIIFAGSIVGIPPTGGSFGKWYLLQGSLEKGDWILFFFLIATVLWNLYYFIKLMILLYEHRGASTLHASPIAAQVPIWLLASGILILGVFHQSIFQHFIEPSLPKAFQNIVMPDIPFLGQQVE